jgi:hypothetical protein
MAYQNGIATLEQCESWRTMRQPPDVFRRPAQQRSFFCNQAAVRRGTHRLDKGKDNAFRGLGSKKLMVCGIDKMPDEKSSSSPRIWRARYEEPVPAQRSARLEYRAIAPQVRRGKRSNPGVRREVRSSVRMGFPAHPAQRLSNG